MYKNSTIRKPLSLWPGQGTLDASDIIQNYVGACITNIDQLREPSVDFGGYYINLVLSPTLNPDQYINLNWQQGDPEIRRRLLYQSSEFAPGGFVDCLTPSDITFFRYGVENIIFAHRSTDPGLWAGGKYLVDWDVFYDKVLNGTINLRHRLRYTVANYVP